jgi:transcriptional regulator with XRE-family HTH domain
VSENMVTLSELKCKFLFTKILPSIIILTVIKQEESVSTMEENRFCHILADLRRKKGVSQRRAAADLHISQALLSHYENGAREPGLPFVCRACDYYGVTADYILGRSTEAGEKNPSAAVLRELASQLRALADQAENYAK